MPSSHRLRRAVAIILAGGAAITAPDALAADQNREDRASTPAPVTSTHTTWERRAARAEAATLAELRLRRGR